MDTYIARQPIFDRNQRVYGYELLYRSDNDNFCKGFEGDRFSSEVITNSLTLNGLETLTRGRKAFINFTRTLLENEIATLLPKDVLVVEILENIEPDENILEACRRLNELGYVLALDDFVYTPNLSPFFDLVNIIKIDFTLTRGKERRNVIQRIENPKIKFLAEKVETQEDFKEAMQLGYSYFQGYFFEKPLMLTGKDIPIFQNSLIQLMQESNKPIPDFNRLEEIVKLDVSLSYKVLRLINSAAFGFRYEIRSIRQALVLLGYKELMKWVTLLTLQILVGDKPDELLVVSVTRAHFLESMASPIGLNNRSSELFIMGLLSLIDVYLEQPLNKVLDDLPLADDIKEALLGTQGKLRELYDLTIYLERGNWDKMAQKVRELSVDERAVASNYLKSLEAANALLNF